jgi:hypothetical protein
MVTGPRCFKCRMLLWSGPVKLLFVALGMASDPWIVAMVMFVEGSLLVYLSIFLYEGFVVCMTMLTNCLLKLVAFCCGVLTGLLPKVMMVLGWVGSFHLGK